MRKRQARGHNPHGVHSSRSGCSRSTASCTPTSGRSQTRNHYWRLANLSASVTYAVELVDSAGAQQDLCLVSIDGVVDGAAGAGSQACGGAQPRSGSYGSVGLSRRRVLLMPGSRAEVFWPYQDPRGAEAVYRLRTVGLNMGNSNRDSQGDQWPATELATVTVAPAPQQNQSQAPQVALSANLKKAAPRAVAAQPAPGPKGAAAPASAAAPATPVAVVPAAPKPQVTRRDLAVLQASNKGCQFLPAEEGYRRQIVFDEREGSGDGGSLFDPKANYPEGSFELGFRVVRGKLGTGDTDPKLGVHPKPYEMPGMAGHGPGAHSPGQHLAGSPTGATSLPTDARPCAVLGRGEVWELVNWTTETHNFHIHQGKFRLARTGDPGLPSGLSAVVFGEKPEHSPIMAFLSLVADASGDVQAWHDTLPVPPRIEDDGNVRPGRVFVYVPFDAPQQEGYFVFHCHILEHEDRGMMANVQVVRHPRGPKLASVER